MHLRGMHKPLKAVRRGTFHLIDFSFEDDMCHRSVQDGPIVIFIQNLHVLRTNHDIDRFIFPESFINTREVRTENTHQSIL